MRLDRGWSFSYRPLSNQKVPIICDFLPPLIEPYVIVAHHTAPLSSYPTWFLDLFFVKYLRPEDSCKLSKCSTENRARARAQHIIYIFAASLFQLHRLLVSIALLCFRTQWACLFAFDIAIAFLYSGFVYTRFGRFGVTLDLSALTCSDKYCGVWVIWHYLVGLLLRAGVLLGRHKKKNIPATYGLCLK